MRYSLLSLLVGVSLAAATTHHRCPFTPLQDRQPSCEFGDADIYTPPAPWTGPEHCSTEYCVYSNPHASHAGLSMITTTHNLSDDTLTANSGLEIELKPGIDYYEAEIPGKGIGLIANRTIYKGEIILQRGPALLIQSTPHVHVPPDRRLEMYEAAVDRLPSETRKHFLRQVGDTVLDKVQRNAFRVFVSGNGTDSAHLGVFPEVSKINHACRPNLHYRLNNTTHTTIAVRDIPPGEELTLTYIYAKLPLAERLTRLRDWGFTCTCSQCIQPTSAAAASDRRLRQIADLEREIDQLMSRRPLPPHMAAQGMKQADREIRPGLVAKLVELYEREELWGSLAAPYAKAALVHAMFGLEEEARGYAEKAVGALLRETGERAKDLPSMRRLVGDPRRHWAWRLKVGRDEGGENGHIRY
ncbi:uncharacterized protein C8A04DRAFT_36681 [Dichotomopilus funicola]|uniref:SET domain-containing protein n=1 Tax=Dichotomopilus funicola TaxID=1934379 RepID=A0AAN6V444_9PEZI|nr:hypothetical protein C8A04DRAFT_36681 [Dichotomopilus funicola]